MVHQIRVGDAGYEARRKSVLWNARLPERRPEVIFAPTSQAEVEEAVRLANVERLKIAIKSGGHSWIGSPLREGGALIDLSAMSSVAVDTEHRVALVEPAATNRDLAAQIVPRGLAFPIGHCPSVGLGGYLVAGGFGWNPGTWGPACWSVKAIEVTTATGESLLIDESNHPDLFWAARGAGPGFPGIVTRFHLRLHTLPKIIGLRTPYRLSALPTLARWAATVMEKRRPGIEISLISRCEPGDDEPRVTISATTFAETVDGAVELVESLDDAPCTDLMIGRPQREEVQMIELEGEGGWTEGLRYAADSCQFQFSSVEEVAPRVERDLRAAPSKLSRIIMVFTSIPTGSRDVPLRRIGDGGVSTYAGWKRPEDDDINVAWTHDNIAGLRPWTVGFYAGECDLMAEPNRAERSFTPANWARLRAIKAKYDPNGRFFDYLGLSS